MEKKYITLKEASRLSGYSPDYIGQLIRQGKLSGKQIYQKPVWITTREALDEYREKSGQGKASFLDKSRQTSRRMFIKLVEQGEFNKITVPVLYFSLFIGIIFSFLFFYILASSIESRLEANALKSLDAGLFKNASEY